MATEQTRHEAADPQTSPSRLQELTSDPELWPLIAANPSAYDSLVAWLGENGDETVRAAIASRPSSGAPAAAAAAGPTPLPPTTTFPQNAPAAGAGGSNKGLWITLGILVFLLLSGGIGAGVWALTKDDDSSTTSGDGDEKDEKQDDDTKDDQKNDDDDEKKPDLDCSDLDDLEDAADDLTYYFPGDDEDDLADAVATIETFQDYDDEAVVEIVETLMTYADALAEDEDEAVVGPEWDDALDAKYDLMDYVFEEC